MNSLILASTSRYRRELLERLNLKFECVAPDVDEDQFKQSQFAPKELAKKLALEKARAVAASYPSSTVIGSDQVAALGSELLSKPKTKENAFRQLSMMAGQDHFLFTAVAVIHDGKEVVFVDETKLSMRNLTDKEIRSYIDQDEPLDCAGSYKIETLGITLFDSIQTDDFTSITGLPLMKLSLHLRQIGYELP